MRSVFVFNERGFNNAHGASNDEWTLMNSDNSAEIPTKSTNIPTISLMLLSPAP